LKTISNQKFHQPQMSYSEVIAIRNGCESVFFRHKFRPSGLSNAFSAFALTSRNQFFLQSFLEKSTTTNF